METERSGRVIRVRRRTTVLLWILVNAIILTITLWLPGKTYRKVDPLPFHDLRLIVHHLAHGGLSVPTLSALLMPMLLNALLFLPWGYLLFMVLDTPRRARSQTYVLVIIFAAALSSFIEGSQYFLPTRVMDIDDVIFNVIGAFAGAVLAHLRRRVRFEFE